MKMLLLIGAFCILRGEAVPRHCQPYADKCPACWNCSLCHWCHGKGGTCSVCLERR